MTMQIDGTELKQIVERFNKAIDEVFGDRDTDMENEAIHGSKQDPFDARAEQYTEEAKKDGEKLVLAMVADPYKMLGEIFQISLNNTECDAGMIIKSKVMRLIEERSLVNETEPTPEEYKKSIWERKQCD